MVDVSLWDEDRRQWSKPNPGIVLVDTQSKYNLITPQFLAEFGLSPSPCSERINITLSNNTEVTCLGQVEARWYCGDPRKVPSFRPRFEKSTFQVVDLETFELVIGSETIVELGLLQGNRDFFGAYRTLQPRVDCTFVTSDCEPSLTRDSCHTRSETERGRRKTQEREREDETV